MKNLPVLKRFLRDSDDPFKSFDLIQRELDVVFNDFFGNWTSPSFSLSGGSYPKINVKENKEGFEIIAATPGLKKEDLSVEYKEGFLTIKGESKQDDICDNERYICRELKKSSFIRTFNVDENSINLDKIKSSYENGELRIFIPKREKIEKKDRILEIKIE